MTKKAGLMWVFSLLLIIPCLQAAAQSAASEDEAAKKEKTSGLAFLPVVFYTPETKWAFGGGGLYYFRLTNKEAIDWLEKAYQAHDQNMPYISVDPIFDDMRADPRFQDFLRRMKLR